MGDMMPEGNLHPIMPWSRDQIDSGIQSSASHHRHFQQSGRTIVYWVQVAASHGRLDP